MAEFSPVALVDPDGQEHTAQSPVELVNLVYGQGYRVKGRGKTIEDALAVPVKSDPKKTEGGDSDGG